MVKKIKIIKLDKPIPSEYKPVELTNIANEVLGYCGRLICGSKSFYDQKYPDNIVYFNANVCTKEDGKIWYGDLDITRDYKLLEELDKRLGKEIFVLSEMMCRFENEERKGEAIEKYASWSSRRGVIND